MKMRVLKNITIDSITYGQHEIGWLRGVRWDSTGAFTYLVDIKGKTIVFEKKQIDFD